MFTEIREITKFRTLITTFAIMDLKLRYRNSILGVVWSFLEPLLILTILNLVFSTILSNNIEHFPIYLILSLTMYNMFVRSTSMSMESMLSKAEIIKSVYVKREVFALSSNLTSNELINEIAAHNSMSEIFQNRKDVNTIKGL